MAIGYLSSGALQSHAPAANMSNIAGSVGSDNATVHIEKFLQADSNFPQLHDLLKCSTDCPSLSGLLDVDYPNLKEFAQTMRSVSQITNLNTVPLPSGLVEQLTHIQQNCEMGLFPEIGRAWLTIDSNIFLWAYDNADDFAYYDGLTETIIGVGLIRPKPGVFRDHIKFLLCLTTAVEIHLLGVTFSADNGPRDFSDLLMLPEPMFTLPTDNVVMNVIAGTALGRCFLAGKDGCLYEATYRADGGWFRRKCHKVNHSSGALSFLVPNFLSSSNVDAIAQIEVDNSRNILYTRSSGGTIDVYDLGIDGTETTRVASKSLSAIVQQASYIARTVDASNFKPIASISPIEESESAFINLVAVTESGVRLYFSASSSFRSYQRPNALTLVHVRLPPGFSASTTNRPVRVHLSHHRRGTSLMISAQSEDKDMLWVLNNDPFPFIFNLMEVSSAVSLNSRVWKLAEEIKPQLVSQLNTVRVSQFDSTVALEPPVVVTQDMEEVRKFVMLSSQGVHIANKPRPVDHLKQILLDNQGFDNEAVKGFFILYKEVQACAIALSLACNSNDKLVAEWATLAFFRYGGESQLSAARTQQFGQHVSTPLSSNQPGPSGFPASPIGYQPTSPFSSPTSPMQTSPVSPTGPLAVEFSHRHDGAYLYFSRIIRSIWNYRVVITETVTSESGPKELLQSSIGTNELSLYIEKLTHLRDFLLKNIQFAVGDNTHSARHLNSSMSAQVQERTSLYSLLQLISNCLEVLGLWKIMHEHQFHTVAEALPADYIEHLKNLVFRDVIIGGNDICARLASSLVQKCIDDNATTDAISHRLKEACPSIFKQENALHAKAHEMLVKAKSVANKDERDKLIEEAAQLFKRVGSRINLRQACELLQAVSSLKNIVDLCISTANQRDPQNHAAHFINNNEPAEDLQGKAAFAARMECYSSLLDTLEKLTIQAQSHVQPGQRAATGGDQPVGIAAMSSEEASREADNFLKQAIDTNDELLHVALYDWLYLHRQNDRLLQIKSPFLEKYLKRKTSTQSDSLVLMDLLWMFYERNGHFRAAAEILHKLAERHGTDIDLYHRLQYMSRAIMSMKSCQTPLSGFNEEKTSGEFLHELEEKMQVASIQLQLLETIQRQPQNQLMGDAVSRLNSDLFDVTQLYEIAEKFDLPEVQLSIVSTANHYDPALIETFWQRIFDKELHHALAQPSDTLRAIIANKLDSMGKHYISSEKYFPLSFIVSYLEAKTQPRNLESSWLAQVLLHLGFSLTLLVETYHKIYKSRTANNTWPGKQIQLLRVLVYLLTIFANSPSSVPRADRQPFVTKSLDVISGYLLDLQSISTSTGASSLVAELRAVQSKLENAA